MADQDNHLACSICFQLFDSDQRRPWDIGCGHSYCEQCLRQHPSSFRYCPECRSRASNPHVNIGLLRLVDAAAGRGTGAMSGNTQLPEAQSTAAAAGSAAITASGQQQQAQQGVRSGADSTNRSYWPVQYGSTAASAGSGAEQQIVRSADSHSLRPSNMHGSLSHHQAKIAEWRSKMWLYLAPLLGCMYVLSPLDIIPDFLPLIGWLDDLLVLLYIASSLYSMMHQPVQQHHQQDRNIMRL